MGDAMLRYVRFSQTSKDRIFDRLIDVTLDVFLVLLDVLAAPVIIPIRLAAHAVKSICKTIAVRETRRLIKNEATKFYAKYF